MLLALYRGIKRALPPYMKDVGPRIGIWISRSFFNKFSMNEIELIILIGKWHQEAAIFL